MNNTDRDYTIQSLYHALLVLESFLEPDRAVQGISEIGSKLGLNKRRVFHILTTLEQRGFVEQDPEGKQYRLSLRFLSISAAVQDRLNIDHIAAPLMDDHTARTGETVHIGGLGSPKAVCITKREITHSVRLCAEIGRRAPSHVGGVPKVLLAYMASKERARLIRRAPLPRITAQTMTDPDRLEKVLDQLVHDGSACTMRLPANFRSPRRTPASRSKRSNM